MRVLSIQQPWAQLVVRGVKQIESRSWPSKQKGRIAIHASREMPLKETLRQWEQSSSVARCFAEQGWAGKDDLNALPRAAIIGTVDLRGVHLATQVRAADLDFTGKDQFLDALANAVRDPHTGKLRSAIAAGEKLPNEIPEKGYVWAFARAREIEPIVGVPGQQHLWNLSAEVAALLTEREAASARGDWRPAPPSSVKKTRALEDWRRRWESDVRLTAARLALEASYDLHNESTPFEDPKAEKRFKRMIREQATALGTIDEYGQPALRLTSDLRPLFEDREVVSVREFEATLREYMHQSLDDDRLVSENSDDAEGWVQLLTELRARAEQYPRPAAEIEAEVREQVKRWFLEKIRQEEKDFVMKVATRLR